MIPGKFLSRLAKFQGIVRMNDFWFPCRLQKLHWALLGLVGRFCTGRTVTTGLLSQEPPRHTGDCSAIHFTKNFLICSNQISEMFRSGHDCTSTSSARNPRYLRLQADVAVPGLSTSSSTTHTENPVPERSGSTSEELRRNSMHKPTETEKNKDERREEVPSDLLHELPHRLQEFRENLVD